MTAAYAYGRDSRLTGLTYGAHGTQLGYLAYTYDADGRRAAVGGSLAAVNPPANASGDAFNTVNGASANPYQFTVRENDGADDGGEGRWRGGARRAGVRYTL